jgi:hypothetical protein
MPLPIVLLALLAPIAAPAEAVQRLSPEQVEQVLDEAAAKREAAEVGLPRPNLIHGEMGVEVGTGGYRAVYGTAVVPLGQDGAAVISVSNVTDQQRYRRRR